MGWHATELRGDLGLIRSQLAAGRPLIALIAVGRDRYHYVTVVGFVDGRVVFHDPAASPYRWMKAEDFARAWSASRFWTLLVLPPETGTRDDPRTRSSPATEARLPPANEPCEAAVRRGVELARTDRDTEAARTLGAASERCPRFARATTWRETTSGRSRAWGRIEPVILEEVTLGTPSRTRQPGIFSLVGLEPGQILTPRALQLGRRRLGMLPAAAATRLDFRPLDGGRRAVATGAVSERPLYPSLSKVLVEGIVSELTGRPLRLSIASPLGGGELWTFEWRWEPNRRRLGVGLSQPVGGALPGVFTLAGLTARETYALGRVDREERRRVEAGLGMWLSPSLRASATVAADHWEGHDLLTDGQITGPLFGRTLVHGGLETVWWHRVGPIDVGGAAFVDLAHAARRSETPGGPGFAADAGLGLRTGLPGGRTFRLDVGRGLLDGATSLSAGLDVDLDASR